MWTIKHVLPAQTLIVTCPVSNFSSSFTMRISIMSRVRVRLVKNMPLPTLPRPSFVMWPTSSPWDLSGSVPSQISEKILFGLVCFFLIKTSFGAWGFDPLHTSFSFAWRGLRRSETLNTTATCLIASSRKLNRTSTPEEYQSSPDSPKLPNATLSFFFFKRDKHLTYLSNFSRMCVI